MEKITPLMKQYNNIKRNYPDTILLFRMGDFFETFFDDAKTISRELNIVLTAREKNKSKQIPLAGVPHRAVEAYIARLVDKGYKVAICDQVEDPKFAKGLVKREVTRVITPGTLLEDSFLKTTDNNYLMALLFDPDTSRFGLAATDISTGEFYATEWSRTDAGTKLNTEIARFNPSECIIPESMSMETNKTGHNEFFQIANNQNIALSPFRDEAFNSDLARDLLMEHFNIVTLEGLGCEDKSMATAAAGAVLSYLHETQKTKLGYINHLNVYSMSDYMVLDATTLRNLELIKSIRDGKRKGTLLEVLDRTVTAMGARLLRKNIQQPLLQPGIINDRLDTVEEFTNNIFLRQDLREQLDNVYDLERLISRVVFGNANARDLLALKQSFQIIPQVKKLIADAKPTVKCKILKDLQDNLPDLSELAQQIDAAILPEPPITIKDGGIIRSGFNDELDTFKKDTSGARTWISNLEAKERRRTGIPNLRVGFNKVFGYYIEIRKTQVQKVPEDYIRKQTLVNAERYVTEELKEKETMILSADEKVKALEYKLFLELRDVVAGQVKEIQTAAHALAELDMFTALSEVAINNGYKRPIITENDDLKIKNGRHPVVETMLDTGFIGNDSELNCRENQLIILTGPNMAGKSTYMRQIALIAIMAQMGSFVPAEHVELGIIDRIFTRVGAFDDLTRGQSTFMVEMVELANILNTATEKSLILLDEIGRGTSTFDGLSIAWAVSEFIHNKSHIGAKTLFATHYHHLNELAEVLPGVRNYNIEVKEDKDNIIFLYKVKPGGTDRSYGIQVARLAGLPIEVIERAKIILSKIESENLVRVNGKTPSTPQASQTPQTPPTHKTHTLPKPSKQRQVRLFAPDDSSSALVDELLKIDIKNISPIQALNKLYELQKKIDKGST